MEKDRPLVPGIVECGLQLGEVFDHAETALGVGVQEGIGGLFDGRLGQAPRRREFEQRLGRFRRQVRIEVEETVLSRGLHVRDPILGNADPEQILSPELGENLRRDRRLRLRLFGLVERQTRRDLLDALTHFDDLDRARLGMRLDAPALRPRIGFVVVVDIGEQQARLGLVDDDPDVAADPGRPEIRVLRLVDAMQLQTGVGRIDLHVEGRRLHGLLVLSRKPGQRVGERGGDEEIHVLVRPQSYTLNTFITSSPK